MDEQAGQKRAGYGEEVVSRFSKDLTHRLDRGFGPRASRDHAAISPDISLARQFPISDWKIHR